MSSHSNIKFLWISFASYLMTLLAIAGFCYVMDPFGVYLKFKIPGVNDLKPLAGAFKYQRIWKPYATYLHAPDGIVLGSSRVGSGINPHHPALASFANKVYNLSVEGGHMAETYRYYQHAKAINNISLVMIGLDPSMFYLDMGDNSNDASFITDSGPLSYVLFKLARDTLFSSDALNSSWHTLIANGEALSDQEGMNNWWRLKIKNRAVKEVGHREYFIRTEAYILDKFIKSNPNVLKDIEHGNGKPFELFRKLLKECIADGTRVILFINPQHARGAELFRIPGHWSHFENWKRSLVRVVSEETDEAPENLVSLWDFGVYNSVTTEPLPPQGDTITHMKFFWEHSHFKIYTGNLVLDRIFDYEDEGRDVPKDFGILLTPDNIESHIKSDRIKQASYIRDNPIYVEEIQKTWGEVLKGVAKY